jgi:hypothetical protein
MGNLKDNCFI